MHIPESKLNSGTINCKFTKNNLVLVHKTWSFLLQTLWIFNYYTDSRSGNKKKNQWRTIQCKDIASDFKTSAKTNFGRVKTEALTNILFSFLLLCQKCPCHIQLLHCMALVLELYFLVAFCIYYEKRRKNNTQSPIIIVNSTISWKSWNYFEFQRLSQQTGHQIVTITMLCVFFEDHAGSQGICGKQGETALGTNFWQPEMLHPLAQLWKRSHFQPHPKAQHLVTTANSETDRSTTVTECHYKRGFQIVFFPILSP